MPKPRTEEQFPLLLVLVGDQDVSQNNKRLFGKGRLNGITSGATAIITEWPNYLSSCWLTALICGITLFIVSILLTSCMTYQQHPRLPRCSSDYQLEANKTIHLVHTSHKWYPSQLDLLHNITNAFPNYEVHLMIIDLRHFRPNKIKKETNETQDMINKTETPDALKQKFPNVNVTHTTYKNLFEHSPLFLNWVSLNHQMKIFAARILQLWQFGGLSFDLLEYKSRPPKRYRNCTNFADRKVRSYIRRACDRYEEMDPDVISVDYNGLHMESRTPCHAFYGKVLMKLRKANERSTPREILNGPMFTFCRAGVIDKEFCHLKHILF